MSTQEAGGGRSFRIVSVLIPHMWSGDGGPVLMLSIALDIECYWYPTRLLHCTTQSSARELHRQITQVLQLLFRDPDSFRMRQARLTVRYVRHLPQTCQIEEG